MIDDPIKTDLLLAALRAALPFEVVLAPSVPHSTRADIGAAEPRARLLITAVDYAGDEGGIVCLLDRSSGRKVAAISLTHVRVLPSMPLASAVLRYRKHRTKKLKKQQWA
jgi:hypothetical protein